MAKTKTEDRSGVFRFPDLPTELRLYVYDTYITTYFTWPKIFLERILMCTLRPLLHANKQIREEVLQHYGKSLTLSIGASKKIPAAIHSTFSTLTNIRIGGLVCWLAFTSEALYDADSSYVYVLEKTANTIKDTMNGIRALHNPLSLHISYTLKVNFDRHLDGRLLHFEFADPFKPIAGLKCVTHGRFEKVNVHGSEVRCPQRLVLDEIVARMEGKITKRLLSPQADLSQWFKKSS